jgi:hypothetical protein
VIHKYSPVPPCRSFHLPYSYLISREYLKWKSSPFCASVLLITMCMRTLRILSCKHCPNFEFFINSISYSFRSIAHQNGVRYSDSTSYFKKYSSSKCKQTVCLHYGLDFHFKPGSHHKIRTVLISSCEPCTL